MNFPVPWRALLPVDAVSTFSGADGLREICDLTGAGCELSGDGDVPASLADKILTISGNVEQKEAACRRVVDKLRVLQDVVDQEPGVFVIIVPSSAAPAVIGTKGSQIKEVIELSGAEVSVAKESIIGMNDQPIGVTGTGGQVVSAVSKINAILQDLADRGRLQPTDFRYRPGSVQDPGSTTFSATRAPPTGGNPRTNAKFVVATQVAGWIIGKQGRHIRELQDNSGAHIQVMKEGEVPPGVPATDRIVEIGGRPDAKAEGIQIILIAVDSMPAMSAPRETLMLIPRPLTTEAEVKDVQQMSGCEIEVRDLPSHDEGLCTLIGTLEARVKAAQQFLKRLEEVIGDGPMPSSFPPAAPREEKTEANDWSKAPLSDRKEDDPWSRSDPWSRGAATGVKEPAKPREEARVTFDNHPQVTNIQASYAPREPEMSFGPGSRTGTAPMSFSPNTNGTAPTNGSNFAPSGTSMSFSPDPGKTSFPGKMSFSPNEPGKMSFGPQDPPGGKMSFGPSDPPGKMSFGPTEPSGGGKMSFSPNEPAGGKMSFSPNDPPGGKMSFSPNDPPGGKMSFGPTESSGGKMSFSPNDPPGGKMSFGSSEPSGGKMSFSPNDSGGKMSFSPNDPPGGKMSFSPEPAGAPTGGKMSFSPEPAGGKMSFSPNEPSGKMSFGPSEGSGGKMSFGPSEPSGGKMSFGPSEPSGGCVTPRGRFDGGPSKTAESTGKLSFGPNDPPTGGDSRGVNPFGQMGGMGPMGMGMGLDSEFMFRAALQQGMRLGR
ncbi:unnamed protein product, partial [Durusdinium trenchii]